jgi:hypothetical protein
MTSGSAMQYEKLLRAAAGICHLESLVLHGITFKHSLKQSPMKRNLEPEPRSMTQEVRIGGAENSADAMSFQRQSVASSIASRCLPCGNRRRGHWRRRVGPTTPAD